MSWQAQVDKKQLLVNVIETGGLPPTDPKVVSPVNDRPRLVVDCFPAIACPTKALQCFEGCFSAARKVRPLHPAIHNVFAVVRACHWQVARIARVKKIRIRLLRSQKKVGEHGNDCGGHSGRQRLFHSKGSLRVGQDRSIPLKFSQNLRTYAKVTASTFVFSVPFVPICRSKNRRVSFHP